MPSISQYYLVPMNEKNKNKISCLQEASDLLRKIDVHIYEAMW